VNLLETAGFSRSNPYYMVQQGKILSLAEMSEEATLGLLKEVAGTKVYEKKKEESEKILLETKSKKEQIESVLKYIEEKLSELEEEQQELLNYQKLDKERRSIEHCIYTKEQQQAIDRLKMIEKEKEEISKNLNLVYEKKSLFDDEIKEITTQIKKLTSDLSDLNKKKESDLQDKKDLLSKKAILELDHRDINSQLEHDVSFKEEFDQEMNTVNKSILIQENEIDSLDKKKIELLSQQKKVEEK
jgi:structural maintenance of chromosome 3 (chondroitin sulfate proteoglycan 6)